MTISAQQTTLANLRDQARPLLLFAGANDPGANRQIAELSTHAADLRDRDMRIVLIGPASGEAAALSHLPTALLSLAEQENARKRFHVPDGQFAVVLVGKDGGEKLRSDKPIAWTRLASTVDAMPMRRDEMKQR